MDRGGARGEGQEVLDARTPGAKEQPDTEMDDTLDGLEAQDAKMTEHQVAVAKEFDSIRDNTAVCQLSLHDCETCATAPGRLGRGFMAL